MKNIILDLDGTLIDSSKGIYNALATACLTSNCKVPDIERLRQFIGPPISTIIDEICEDASLNEKQKICDNFRRNYDSIYCTEVKWYDNTIDTLKELKRNNHELFIVTNKPTVPSIKIVENANISKIFNSILGIDYRPINDGVGGNFPEKKDAIEYLIKNKDLDKDQCLYIGDTLGDKEACSSSHIKFIAAEYGFHDWTSKNKEFSTCISNFRELLNHLE